MEVAPSIETKTINDLPIEILEEIFAFLDYKSLKTSTLVSKRLNEIISSSKDFIKRTSLNVYDRRQINGKYVQYQQLSRKYQSVNLTIENHSDSGKKQQGQTISKIRRDTFHILNCALTVTTCGDYLKSLYLQISRINNEDPDEGEQFGNLILNLLKHCTKLEQLIIIHYFDDKIKIKINNELMVKMSSLKKLHVHNFDCILKHIECDKLQDLNVSNNNCNEDDNDDHIVSFINEQTELEFLTTGSRILNSLESQKQQQLSPLKFQWKYFTISDSYYPPFKIKFGQNLIKLLESAASDARISLIHVDWICRNLQVLPEFITKVADFKNINQLEIKLTRWDEHLEFYIDDDHAPYINMNHIKTLRLKNFYTSQIRNAANVESLISLFKNIEMLDINFRIGYEYLAPMFAKITSLRHLRVSSALFLDMDRKENVPILSNIETIEIDGFEIHDKMEFKNYFGKRHSTLRRAIVSNISLRFESDKVFTFLIDHYPSVQVFEVSYCLQRYKSSFIYHEESLRPVNNNKRYKFVKTRQEIIEMNKK